MKKYLFVFSAAAVLTGCPNDKVAFPDSLMIEETDLTFVAEGETYLNKFYTTAGSLTISVPQAAAQWLAVQEEAGYLKMQVQPNQSLSPRSASVAVKSGMRTLSVKVTQSGLPAIKLQIESADASSSQSRTCSSDGHVSCTYNGIIESVNDRWHSCYGGNCECAGGVACTDSKAGTNHWLEYTLPNGTPTLAMINLYARYHTNASCPNTPALANGRWGYYFVWVKGDVVGVEDDPAKDGIRLEADTPLPIGTTDEGYTLVWKGDETAGEAIPYAYCGSKLTSIVLPQVVNNPSKVKIVIKGSGTGTARSGNAALTEIEFYGLAN